jgi:hypothetical protein
VSTGNSNSCGWFKAFRSEDARELVKANPLAFVLAWEIAQRARWTDGYNLHGLALGEAMLGDYTSYGMSEQQYRTAKKILEKGGFATFKSTSKGTIARLTDTRLFEVNERPANEHNDGPPTSVQRTDNEQATTNSEGKNIKKEEKGSERSTLAPAALKSNCPPDLKDVVEHGKTIGCPEEIARGFFNHFASCGWMMKSGVKMVDFKPALCNWLTRELRTPNSPYRKSLESDLAQLEAELGCEYDPQRRPEISRRLKELRRLLAGPSKEA